MTQLATLTRAKQSLAAFHAWYAATYPQDVFGVSGRYDSLLEAWQAAIKYANGKKR